ncbi:MAG: amphi-Trp domain-containing protein [Chloroflexota bacterium]|nr:amphi-Trp domain-containing protein [Chloroflexota bacterium]
MAKKTSLFRQKTRKTKDEVSEFLQELGQKIAEGQVVLKQTPDDLVLEMPQHMSLKVKVTKKNKKVKGTRHKMSISLSWYDSDHQGDPLALG